MILLSISFSFLFTSRGGSVWLHGNDGEWNHFSEMADLFVLLEFELGFCIGFDGLCIFSSVLVLVI